MELPKLNYLKFYFLLISIAAIFLGILINHFERYLPSILIKTTRCGKFAFKGKTKIPTIEFPKSTFQQFYKIGTISIFFIYFFTVQSYIFGFDLPKFIKNLLVLLTSEKRIQSNVTATNTFIALTLILLQIIRRYYDTHYVSIFSKNSKINLTHWSVGITYYPILILSIISEAPNFSTNEHQLVNLYDVGYIDCIGIVLFMWSWWHQHKCTVILANLRKNKKDTGDYKLPKGDWFDYLSSPHCTAEILMYTSLTLFLWRNSTWWYVMLWIYSNQIESILLSHWWYQETFKQFPNNRKALIPFAY